MSVINTTPENWKNDNNKLTREFKFSNFLTALDFVNLVGATSEKIGHHPEIWFTWGKVIITTTTHDTGNTVTQKDLQLALAINLLSLENNIKKS
jgi:4a-hydroxytetrahydrobiopterin dehydratase